LCKPEAYGEILNIGTGSPTTIRKLIETLCEVLERPLSEIEIVEEQGTVGDPFYSVACCSKAKDILGFTAQNDLPKGLAEIVRLRKNL
jgi:nucleoside-diphosphate-sugar epimerase